MNFQYIHRSLLAHGIPNEAAHEIIANIGPAPWDPDMKYLAILPGGPIFMDEPTTYRDHGFVVVGIHSGVR
jgi:hypothetical protein